MDIHEVYLIATPYRAFDYDCARLGAVGPPEIVILRIPGISAPHKIKKLSDRDKAPFGERILRRASEILHPMDARARIVGPPELRIPLAPHGKIKSIMKNGKVLYLTPK